LRQTFDEDDFFILEGEAEFSVIWTAVRLAVFVIMWTGFIRIRSRGELFWSR
jgi:hypothetical protein